MKNEEKFYEALERIFEGAPIDGNGGYINLLHIKQKYYKEVISEFKKKVDNDILISDDFKEDFFDLLYTFFEKYFSESGSVYFTKTSANDKIYEKVYENNKDVSLFWKTNMLYYVKTDVLYNSTYITVHSDKQNLDFVFYFDVSNLNLKKNNEKQTINFIYKEKKKGKIPEIHTELAGDVSFVIDVTSNKTKTDVDAISSSTGINEVEVIEKAIKMFNKQSSIDYFINKNAKVFLEEQLELFLHIRLFEDTNVFDAEKLSQYKKFKEYAKHIINFISQFENELVRIWNKPKFVLNSNYVISLDRINDSIIEKIKKHKNLKEQINEWQKLGMVDEKFKFDEEEIKEHTHLPIDTKYFKDLELEIIGQFDNLDEALDGRLIHSENYQALNCMQNKYNNSIRCIYIDPPFNTGKDFEYLDGYQDSTWLSIMNDRISFAHKFLDSTGGIFVHLDRYANYMGRQILNNVFGKDNYRAEIYWDTCGNTGFKTSKNNWYQNTNSIIQYAKDFEKYLFNKQYKLLNVNDPVKEKEENNQYGTSWLDIEKNDKGNYIEKYVNGKYEKIYIEPESKVDPIGMIWTDVLSFLYTQVGNNESYFFNGGQKPECLLSRIIKSQTKENDFVMDFFSGIGTTCAVAHKLNRKYIGIEMGEHFNTFYADNSKFGILARMKNVLNGDQTFYALNPVDGTLSVRKPNMSRKLDWQGGGFFKYYSLEQYEDTLNRAVYDKNIDTIYENDKFSQYIFFADKKLVDVLDASDDEFNLDFDKLYENIDLPETISLLLGKPIEKITENEVKLEGIEELIKYNTKVMNNEEKRKFVHLLKPLLWWGE